MASYWRQRLGKPECPYAERWKLDFGPLGSICLHRWMGSDDMRANHDHAADFITLVLKGGYTDLGQLPDCQVCDGMSDTCVYCHTLDLLGPGSMRFRKAEHRHRVKINEGGECWTLLYFFPHRRKWGFWVRRKKDGRLKFMKSNKYFLTHGHHPCDD
jgi:hypothetical protein